MTSSFSAAMSASIYYTFSLAAVSICCTAASSVVSMASLRSSVTLGSGISACPLPSVASSSTLLSLLTRLPQYCLERCQLLFAYTAFPDMIFVLYGVRCSSLGAIFLHCTLLLALDIHLCFGHPSLLWTDAFRSFARFSLQCTLLFDL